MAMTVPSIISLRNSTNIGESAYKQSSCSNLELGYVSPGISAQLSRSNIIFENFHLVDANGGNILPKGHLGLISATAPAPPQLLRLPSDR